MVGAGGKGMEGEGLEPWGQRFLQGASPPSGTSRHDSLERGEVGVVMSTGLKVSSK